MCGGDDYRARKAGGCCSAPLVVPVGGRCLLVGGRCLLVSRMLGAAGQVLGTLQCQCWVLPLLGAGWACSCVGNGENGRVGCGVAAPAAGAGWFRHPQAPVLAAGFWLLVPSGWGWPLVSTQESLRGHSLSGRQVCRTDCPTAG